MKPVCGNASASAIEMLAAAEPDLEADAFNWRIEQRRQMRRRLRCNVERKARQQMLDQIGLVDAELVALAPAEKAATGRCNIFGRKFRIGRRCRVAHRNV